MTDTLRHSSAILSFLLFLVNLTMDLASVIIFCHGRSVVTFSLHYASSIGPVLQSFHAANRACLVHRAPLIKRILGLPVWQQNKFSLTPPPKSVNSFPSYLFKLKVQLSKFSGFTLIRSLCKVPVLSVLAEFDCRVQIQTERLANG